MTISRVATEATPLADIAKMFSGNGVEITDWHEGEIGPVHMVRFHGDEVAGFRAVEVAREMGLEPSELHRVWPVQFYDDESHWQLTFFYPNLR